MNHTPFEERKRIYAAAQQKFGADHQVLKATEELGEAIVEIAKALAGESNRDHLAEEIADATIMLEQLRQIFNINESVLTWMGYKLAELKLRVNK